MRQDVRTRMRRAANVSQWLLLGIGILLLGTVSAAYIHRAVMVRRAMHSFAAARQKHVPATVVNKAAPPVEATAAVEGPDGAQKQSLVQAPALGLAARPHADLPLGILRIRKIHLEVPVLSGTDEITLNRGVGRIAGTTVPGEIGNIGIAGHRDGFFRNLKDLNRGDEIELETASASTTYVVERILVTGPDNTSVLQPSRESMLTLVTCYPFHFIGPAPRRFVVQAILK